MPGPANTNALALPDLYAHFRASGLVRRLLELARDEDLGPPGVSSIPGRDSLAPPGDVTTAACIDPATRAKAALVARGGGVLAGLAAIPDLLDLFAPSTKATILHRDGEAVAPKTTVATFDGPLDEILELERTMLNLVGRLSGIATRTAQFVRAVREQAPGSRAHLYDTRKTTPGLRVLEKYAVRCGGGRSHRLGLHDAVLIKDNHIAGVPVERLAATIAASARRARDQARAAGRHLLFVEVEVDTLDQFEALLTLPASPAPESIDIVLLDNMGPEQLAHASRRRDATNPKLELEASGGVNLDTVAALARTGVDRISTGSVTHSAVSLDVALDVVGAKRP